MPLSTPERFFPPSPDRGDAALLKTPFSRAGRLARILRQRLPLYIGRRPGRPFFNGCPGAGIAGHSLFFNELGQCERSLASAREAHRPASAPLVQHPLFRPSGSPSEKPSDPASGVGESEKFCSPCRIVPEGKQKTTARSSGHFEFPESIFLNHHRDIAFRHQSKSAGSLHHS